MADVLAPGTAVANAQARPRMSGWQQAALSLYWFATSAHWGAILITLLPLQAELIGGAAFKGRTLGLILLLGAFVSMAAAPLFGAWSDRIRTPWGRIATTAGDPSDRPGAAKLPTGVSTRPPRTVPEISLSSQNRRRVIPPIPCMFTRGCAPSF